MQKRNQNLKLRPYTLKITSALKFFIPTHLIASETFYILCNMFFFSVHLSSFYSFSTRIRIPNADPDLFPTIQDVGFYGVFSP
jgi:hypothetical protein